MGDREDRGSTSSITAIVVVVVLLLLGLPCLLAAALFAAGWFFSYRAVETPLPPPIVQPAPPVETVPQRAPVAPAPPSQVVPIEETPAEPQAPAPVGDSN